MQHLSGFDGMWYAYDHSETAKAIMGSLHIFEPTESNDAGNIDTVIARYKERLKVLPPLRRKVEGVPVGINNQYWRECTVNVADHIRQHTIAAPGSDRELADAVGAIMNTGLDRSKPMWDCTIFHGLSGGRQAHLLRVHHAACDGGTMQRILGLLSDYSDEFAPNARDYPSPLQSDGQARLEMFGKGVRRAALMPAQLFEAQKHTLKWFGGRVRKDGTMAAPALVARMLPGALGRPLADLVNSRLGPDSAKVQPIQPRLGTPDSIFNVKITAERSIVWGTLPMSDLLRIGKHFGVTFHSVVTAISASAARQYLIAKGEPVDEPLILMSPYSLRRGGEENYWANYALNFLAEFPVHLSDPVERLKVCGKNVAEAKANFDTLPTDLMIDMSRMIPQIIWDTIYKAVDRAPEEMLKRTAMGGNFTVSNIRGPSKRFHMFGADITHFIPVSFLGQGLAHTLACSSYAGELQVGIVACPTVFPQDELWDWTDYLRGGMEELLERVDGQAAKPAAPVAVTALAKSGPPTTRKATAPRKAAAGGRAPAKTAKKAATKAAQPAAAAKAAPAGRKGAAAKAAPAGRKTAAVKVAPAKSAPAKGAPAGRKSPAARRAAAAAASVQPVSTPVEPTVLDPATPSAAVEPMNGVPVPAVDAAE